MTMLRLRNIFDPSLHPRKSNKASSRLASCVGIAIKVISNSLHHSRALFCGRSPADAHHLRFAQPRGMGLKVSDEFTVPLCRSCHRQNHQVGDERSWWKKTSDPLKVAERLWSISRGVVDRPQ